MEGWGGGAGGAAKILDFNKSVCFLSQGPKPKVSPFTVTNDLLVTKPVLVGEQPGRRLGSFSFVFSATLHVLRRFYRRYDSAVPHYCLCGF